MVLGEHREPAVEAHFGFQGVQTHGTKPGQQLCAVNSSWFNGHLVYQVEKQLQSQWEASVGQGVLGSCGHKPWQLSQWSKPAITNPDCGLTGAGILSSPCYVKESCRNWFYFAFPF